MYIVDWYLTTQQLLINSGVYNTTIIPVLLTTQKTVFTINIEDLVQWPIYLIIS